MAKPLWEYNIGRFFRLLLIPVAMLAIIVSPLLAAAAGHPPTHVSSRYDVTAADNASIEAASTETVKAVTSNGTTIRVDYRMSSRISGAEVIGFYTPIGETRLQNDERDDRRCVVGQIRRTTLNHTTEDITDATLLNDAISECEGEGREVAVQEIRLPPITGL